MKTRHGPIKPHPSFAVMCQRALRSAGYSYCWECLAVKCTDDFYLSRNKTDARCKPCKNASRGKLYRGESFRTEHGTFPPGYETPEQRARRMNPLVPAL